MTQISIGLHYFSIGIFCIALVYGAISDLRTLEIPNRVPIAIALTFLPAALIAAMVPINILFHYGVALIIFAVGAVLFAKGYVGGGDVKFLAAVCVWWDVWQLGAYLVTVGILGGALALFVIFAGRMELTRRVLPWLETGGTMNQPIPYGVAIAGGALIMFATLPVLPAELVSLLTD
jgi:prepilin peptidase CpaA